jgi:diguanylate cyclase (GGDEF)-like protein
MVEKLGRTDRFLILKKPFDNIEVRQFAMALTERWSLARTDSLTGILNRRSLHEHLQREWARSVRHETPLACVMLDLDYFKKINDVEGHQAGDAVLKAVASAIQSCCRASDLLFRYGGEEFCVVLPHTGDQGAVAWAERARAAIAATCIPYDDRMLHVTASIGVAERQADTRSAEALVDRADEALRIAKHAGRNRVICATRFDTVVPAGAEVGPQTAGLLQGVSACDVMLRHVATLTGETTVGEAARYFLDRGLNSAPVVDDDGKLVGVVSEKDVLSVMLAPDSWGWPISRICQPDVVSYDERTPVEKIFDFLSRVTMRRVVIVRNGRPIGSISRTSLLRWFANWVLTQSTGLNAVPRSDRSISKARLAEAARSLATRAARLAEKVSTNEAVPLSDDIYGPMSDDVATIHELFREIVRLSNATGCPPSGLPASSSLAPTMQPSPVCTT